MVFFLSQNAKSKLSAGYIKQSIRPLDVLQLDPPALGTHTHTHTFIVVGASCAAAPHPRCFLWQSWPRSVAGTDRPAVQHEGRRACLKKKRKSYSDSIGRIKKSWRWWAYCVTEILLMFRHYFGFWNGVWLHMELLTWFKQEVCSYITQQNDKYLRYCLFVSFMVTPKSVCI